MRILCAVAILLMLGRFAAVAAQDDHIGIVRNASGEVRIERGDAHVTPLPGTKLKQADIVISGKQGSAGIVFVDGTALTLGASTELQIRGYRFLPDQGDYDFSVFLKRGSAIYSSGKLGKLAPESVKVSTPRAVVGVRGTRFIIKSD
jgi:hypothetical protein